MHNYLNETLPMYITNLNSHELSVALLAALAQPIILLQVF